jgi:cobalt-zinc-cadmium efflux system outer membrane protein
MRLAACLLVTLLCAPVIGSATQPPPPEPASPRGPAGRPVAATPSPPPLLGLEEARALARRHDPALAASSRELRAREAEIAQAGVAPNPELEVEVENFGGGGEAAGFGNAETTVMLAQRFELGGKRDRRRELASAAHRLGAGELERLRLEVDAEVTRRFITVLERQERLLLADTLIAVSEAMLVSIEQRVEAGALSPVEASRARIELATGRIDRDRVARELEIARTRLAASWGDSIATFHRAVGELERLGDPPGLPALLAGIEEQPEIARWRREADLRRAAVALERARVVPDLSLAGGWRWIGEAETSAFLIAVGLPLPFRDRNRGAIEAAEHRLLATDDERRATRTRLVAALTARYRELQAAADEAATLHQAILPEAVATAETARRAHARGQLTLTDVLDTQRLLFELRGRHITALATYHRRRADLQRLTGTALPDDPGLTPRTGD